MSIMNKNDVVASIETGLVETGMFEKDSAGTLWLKFDEIELRFVDGLVELRYSFRGKEAITAREHIVDGLRIKNIEGRMPMRIM